MNAYIKKVEKSQISNPMLHLKEIDKGEQTTPTSSKKEDLIEIKVEIKKIKTDRKVKKYFFLH